MLDKNSHSGSVFADLDSYLRKLVEAQLWVKVLIAMALGIGLGVMLSPETGWISSTVSQTITNWLGLPGKLFLKLVQMIMIPLIFTSIISGIIGTSGDELKKMGLRLLLYFVATTFISVIIGIFLAMLVEPGRYIYEKGGMSLPPGFVPPPSSGNGFTNIPESISQLLPDNPLAAMVTGEMLSIVIFTIIVGIAVSQLSDTARAPMIKLFSAIQEICMTIVSWAMKLVPYAVFGLMAQLTANVGVESLTGLGIYIGIVIFGLICLLLIYLAVIRFGARQSPRKFLNNIREVQLLAFSTTSSAAVMPLSIKTAQEKLGVSSKIANFIIPVGATINMDGTALFQCISTIFIAQAYGMEMSMANTLLIMVTIVAASIGTPAIPGGGVVILASVLQSAGIPTEGIVIIIGVERILGMFRTAVNVTGDLTAAVLFQRWSDNKSKKT